MDLIDIYVDSDNYCYVSSQRVKVNHLIKEETNNDKLDVLNKRKLELDEHYKVVVKQYLNDLRDKSALERKEKDKAIKRYAFDKCVRYRC